MRRDLILGTAGHIDHGKTALVRALTGIDCDRLPEEKARGITIDLGFAHLTVGDLRFGIVDVPGHQRFIRNMLAGATGLDLALLVVSAVESVKPQTREHLEILELLGVRRGVVALTKADAVDEETRKVVELEIAELVGGTFLEGSAVVATSAVTGHGIAELKAALCEAAKAFELADDPAEPFRLAIDRAFVVQGHGTVVTGTVLAGVVRTGAELEWHRGDGSKRTVRVRNVNNHGREVASAGRGQRAALNLAGVELADVGRGQELATPGFLVPSRLLTVELHVPKHSHRVIGPRTPSMLHIGTAEIFATMTLLDRDVLAAGQTGYAQIQLLETATAVWGQAFVLRDSSGETTLGGGRVLQPTPHRIRRRHWDQLERIEQLASEYPRVRAEAGVWFASSRSLPEESARRELGIPPEDTRRQLDRGVQDGTFTQVDLGTIGSRLLHSDRVREIEERILVELQTRHEQRPIMTNHDAAAVLSRLGYLGDPPLLHAIAARMRKQKRLVGDARLIARADFQPRLSAGLRKLKDKIVEAHRVARFHWVDPQGFATAAGGNAVILGEVYEVACAEGHLVPLNTEVYLHKDAVAEMLQKVKDRLRSGGATVAELRDLLGGTRKVAIPACEYLDRMGVTVRKGDLRQLVETERGDAVPPL